MSYGFTNVRVLPDLEGKPWNEITQAYMRSLRPSVVRVVPDDGTVTSDARLWRVTVYLTASGKIRLIDQEVEVDLPVGVDHGYALDRRLGTL